MPPRSSRSLEAARHSGSDALRPASDPSCDGPANRPHWLEADPAYSFLVVALLSHVGPQQLSLEVLREYIEIAYVARRRHVPVTGDPPPAND
jgi:hypothetical protein